jgi:hypothetical protein
MEEKHVGKDKEERRKAGAQPHLQRRVDVGRGALDGGLLKAPDEAQDGAGKKRARVKVAVRRSPAWRH